MDEIEPGVWLVGMIGSDNKGVVMTDPFEVKGIRLRSKPMKQDPKCLCYEFTVGNKITGYCKVPGHDTPYYGPKPPELPMKKGEKP